MIQRNRNIELYARNKLIISPAKILWENHLSPDMGINRVMNDKNFVKYDSHLPAMAYMDAEPSYASNEVAINRNAPATVIFAILDYVLGEK